MKDAQHHSLSEKGKSKPQWGTISRQSEWLRSKSVQAIHAGEKETLLHCWWECKLVQPLWRTVWRFLKKLEIEWSSVQFSSVAQSCLTLCDLMNHSTLGLPVHHQLPEFTQTHVHWVGDAIQPSHPLSSPSPPDPNPSQHQSLFQWVNSLHEVAKVLEFQLQHQSFQWTPRPDLL